MILTWEQLKHKMDMDEAEERFEKALKECREAQLRSQSVTPSYQNEVGYID